MIAPRPGLRDVAPYESPQLDVDARLNTNESPYPLPDGFADDLAKTVRDLSLNRYPDREAAALRAGLAEVADHPLEGTWVANGSNEILLQLLQAYGGPGRPVVVFEPTYALYSRLAWVIRSDVVAIRLEPPWRIDARHVAEAWAADPPVVFVCSPNNPTGNVQPEETIRELVAREPTLVVVDEAYIEFGGTRSRRSFDGTRTWWSSEPSRRPSRSPALASATASRRPTLSKTSGASGSRTT